MDTKTIIDRIFRDPKTKYELSEFENLGKPIEEILNIYPKVIESGHTSFKNIQKDCILFLKIY
jgi:type I restriction enzyme M protein